MQELLSGKSRLPGFSEEWEIIRFGDLGHTYGGITGKNKADFGIGSAKYIPFLNVLTNVVINFNQFEKVNISYQENQNRVIKGDLFFNSSSETPEEVGMCAVLLEDVENVYLNSFCFGFRLYNNFQAIGLYLAYFFRSSAGRKLLYALAQGATRHNLSKTALLNLKFGLPSQKEQRLIATALSDVDDLIASLDKLIAKKRLIKQGAMQELLTGKTRLQGFRGEWETIRFEDIADKNVRWSITGGPFGSNLKASDYVSGGIRIIQLQNIGDGIFHDDYAIYTTEQKADELLSCNIYPGEIILSKMGDPVARACYVPTNNLRYLMASDGIRLVVDERRFDKRFVFYYINSMYFRNKAIEASTGTTRLRIGLGDLKIIPFATPSKLEQQAIGEILYDMDAEITALEQRRDKTRLLKQGMMQELLTGRIRLI